MHPSLDIPNGISDLPGIDFLSVPGLYYYLAMPDSRVATHAARMRELSAIFRRVAEKAEGTAQGGEIRRILGHQQTGIAVAGYLQDPARREPARQHMLERLEQLGEDVDGEAFQGALAEIGLRMLRRVRA